MTVLSSLTIAQLMALASMVLLLCCRDVGSIPMKFGLLPVKL